MAFLDWIYEKAIGSGPDGPGRLAARLRAACGCPPEAAAELAGTTPADLAAFESGAGGLPKSAQDKLETLYESLAFLDLAARVDPAKLTPEFRDAIGQLLGRLEVGRGRLEAIRRRAADRGGADEGKSEEVPQ